MRSVIALVAARVVSAVLAAVSSAALSVALSALTPSAAAAQPAGASEPAEYQVLIERALSEYSAHNFAEARALFLKAHEASPSARTLRGLGMTEFELKNYGDCIARLEQALASQVKPLDAGLRAQTEELLGRARGFVARFELQIEPPALAGTKLVVDGAPVELAAGQALTLTVGEHTLQVQAPGDREERRALSVKGGEQQPLSIVLQPQSAPALATSAPPARDDDTLWTSPWLWTGVGAVVAGGILTAVLLSSGSGEDVKPIAGDIGGVVQALPRK